MVSGHDSDFESLLARMVDEELTPHEARRFGTLLRGNPERQRLYHLYLLNHLLLEQEGVLLSEAACAVESPESQTRLASNPSTAASPTNHARRARSTNSGRHTVKYAIAAILLLSAGVSALFALRPDSKPELATVIDQIGVEGAPRELTAEGAILDIGLPLTFQAGLISVAMPSGAEFVLEGPASIVVQDPNRVRLDYGKLYAVVPPPSTGFTVESQSASLVDLGTEFGVEAHSDGSLDSYVYVGSVRVESAEEAENVVKGQAVAVSSGGQLGPVREFEQTEARFARSLDGVDYLSAMERLGPVYMHRFSKSKNRRQFLNDLGDGRYELSIQGGVYAAAGGPVATPETTDGYLRFVGVESTSTVGAVSHDLHAKGEYSLVTWVRVDESGPQGILALSGERGPDLALGAVLRITTDGLLEHRCHHEGPAGYVLQTSDRPLGRREWVQVVVTGGSNRDLNLYVNGERAAKPVRMSERLVTDCGQLLLGSGSGRGLEDGLHTGPLRGAMDEVALFDRILTAAEVRALYSSSTLSRKFTRL